MVEKNPASSLFSGNSNLDISNRQFPAPGRSVRQSDPTKTQKFRLLCAHGRSESGPSNREGILFDKRRRTETHEIIETSSGVTLDRQQQR